MPTTVYWDACIFHALLGEEPDRVESCKLIERDAKAGLTLIYTSAVTLTECVWVKGQNRITYDHELAIHNYFAHKFIRLVNCDRRLAEQARLLLWKYSHLRPKDAIHVATAIDQQVDVMHTYDNDDLVKLNGLIGSPPLRIENPPPPPAPNEKPTTTA